MSKRKISAQDKIAAVKRYLDSLTSQRILADVTEFHYYMGIEKHKVYLSAILDLYDRRIVSYVIRDHNNNALVLETAKMTQSMSRVAKCIDNGPMEGKGFGESSSVNDIMGNVLPARNLLLK